VQLQWHIQSKCFGSLEIEYKLELGWLDDWHFGRIFALENAAGIDAANASSRSRLPVNSLLF
jgi:hypothetical protein